MVKQQSKGQLSPPSTTFVCPYVRRQQYWHKSKRPDWDLKTACACMKTCKQSRSGSGSSQGYLKEVTLPNFETHSLGAIIFGMHVRTNNICNVLHVIYNSHNSCKAAQVAFTITSWLKYKRLYLGSRKIRTVLLILNKTSVPSKNKFVYSKSKNGQRSHFQDKITSYSSIRIYGHGKSDI